jgi:hypothetical protein
MSAAASSMRAYAHCCTQSPTTVPAMLPSVLSLKVDGGAATFAVRPTPDPLKLRESRHTKSTAAVRAAK